jgi:hypothetical protein
MADFSSCLKQLVSLIDSVCVFKEGGLFLHVQLKGVSILKDVIQIKLERLPTIGFGTRPDHTFTIESTVETTRFSKNKLSISYVGVELFTGKADVLKIVKFAEGMADPDGLLNVIQEIRRENMPKKFKKITNTKSQ